MTQGITREQAIEGVKRAAAAGDVQAANELAAYADSLQETPVLPDVVGGFTAGVDALKEGLPQVGDDLQKALDPMTMATPTEMTADLIRAGGSAVGTGLSAVGAGIEGAWGDTKVGKTLAPYGEKALSAIVNNPLVQSGLEAIESGVKTWDELFKESPEIKSQVEDALIVGATVAPLPKGKSLVKKGTLGKQLQRKTDIIKFMEPVTPDTDLGNYFEYGLLRNRGFTPKDSLQDVYNQLDILPKFDPKRSYNYNQNVVRARISQSAEDLLADLKKEGNVKVDMPKLREEFDEILIELQNRLDSGYLSGDAYKPAVSMIEEVITDLPKKPTTTQILKARKALDAKLKKARGADTVFNPDRESGLSIASREVRQALNDSIHAKSSSSYGLLEEQHLLYRALDRLDEGLKIESKTGPGRAIESVLPIGMHLPTTPLALGATVGAATALNPAAVGTAAGVVGAGLGLRGLYRSRHGARQFIGRLIRDNSLAPAQRMAIIDLIREDMQTLPEQEEAQNVSVE